MNITIINLETKGKQFGKVKGKMCGRKKRTQVGKVNEKEVWDTDEGYGQRQ
jgi:hypothetical protein